MLGHIFKYELPIIGEVFELKLPKDCTICDIQLQENVICLWAIVDTHAEFITHKFLIVGTGWKIDDVELLNYMKTIQMPNGLVYHVFQLM